MASVTNLVALDFYFGDRAIAEHANYLGKYIFLKLFY